MPTTVLDDAMRELASRIPPWKFASWFEPLRFVSDDGATVRLRVPNALFRDWFHQRYATTLNDALARVGRPGTRVELVLGTVQDGREQSQRCGLS